LSLIPRKLRDSVQRLRDSEPGCRFQDRFHERQEGGRSAIRRWLYLGGGTVIVLAGIFFLPAPGPGFIIIFLGGGLLAQESLVAARALDWTEVRLRKIGAWAKGIWDRASMPVRALIVVVIVAVAGAAAYGAYWFMFER
jgi:uncharacterized protein (TIGR02611 family)